MAPRPSLRLALALLLAGLPGQASASPTAWPPVATVADRLRAELPDLAAPPAETHASNYLRSLAPRVLWPAPVAETAPTPALTRTNVYSGNAAYLRVGSVGPELPDSLRSAISGLRASGAPLAGLILDLRFAAGSDYAAAAAAASVFARRPIEPLRLGEHSYPVTHSETASNLPVLVLVHRATRGAAEALAAAVRAAAGETLLIGTNTAGQARNYRPFQIVDGLDVGLAGTPLTLPDGNPFPLEGLVPDLKVAVASEDEARYFTNEFARVTGGRGVHGAAAFRLNEAELVRQMRSPRGRGGRPAPAGPLSDSEESGADGRARKETEGGGEPPVRDPVLARALDLLSGLADQKAASPGLEASGNSR